MQRTADGMDRRATVRMAMVMMVLLGVIALGVAVPSAGRAATVQPPTIGATQTVAAAATLTAVACPTSSTCYAVGTGTDADGNDDGVVVTISNGVPGASVPVPGGGATELGLSGISCPTVTTCYAVGSELDPVATTDSGAEVVTISSGNPAAAVPAPPTSADESYALLNDIACISASSCLAVGEETNAEGSIATGASSLITGGAPGTLVQDSAVESLNGVWCQSTSCQAGASVGDSAQGGTNGALVALSSAGAPGAPQTLTSLAGVGLGTCPPAATTTASTPLSCLVLGYTGADADDEVLLPVASQTAGTAAQAPDLLALGCATSVSCVGVGATDDGTAVATAIADGTAGSPVGDADTNVDGLDAVACATATSCIAVGVGDDNAEGVVVPITLPVVALPPGAGGGGSGGSGGSGGAGGSSSTDAHLTVSDVKVTGAKVTLHLSCSKAARCAGAVTEAIRRATTVKGKRTTHTITIGRDAYGLPAGTDVTKTIMLNPTGRHDLADATRHELRSRLAVTLGSGATAATVSHRTVILRPTVTKKKQKSRA
jgi:hypothetical protein